MRPEHDARVVVLAATRKDAALTRLTLSGTHLPVIACDSFDGLLLAAAEGASVVVVVEEALTSTRTRALAKVLAQQPPWSDLPLLIIARPGADSSEVGEAVASLGNVTVLERPLRRATLLSAVRSGIRARDRQYQIRAHLADHTRAEQLLRRADRRKDEFLATLGHELRNPLAPLLTGAQLLRVRGRDEAVVARVSAVMERQVLHLTRLVDDLLELSRITRGLIDVKRTPMDLAAAARLAINTMRAAVDAASLRLEVDLPERPVPVDGDSDRLTQVFVNLLSNAAKYTNAGGWIRFSLHADNTRAVVSVKDNGIGIPTDQLQSIFDMFAQVDRANRRSQGGLGVGLTLVQSLIAQHHGRVEARSEGPGQGSEFIIELPLADAAVAAERSADPPRSFPERRILIVDDNVDAANTLGQLLEVLGVTVSLAYSPGEALRAFSSFNPDVVLLDIGMPGMNGYEVARCMRDLRTGDSAPMLIALTGWGQPEDRERSAQVGIDHHMVKPPDVDVLRDLLLAG
jgi:signal transduction histidine kinase